MKMSAYIPDSLAEKIQLPRAADTGSFQVQFKFQCEWTRITLLAEIDHEASLVGLFTYLHNLSPPKKWLHIYIHQFVRALPINDHHESSSQTYQMPLETQCPSIPWVHG
jgi:hypothetical protein